MHLIRKSMHAFGILIFLIEFAGTSCVMTVSSCAWACATR
jgi:hypothetical protein